MSESKTPRTRAMLDANGIRCACSDKPVELCHTLETELQQAKEQEILAKRIAHTVHLERVKLTTELAQMRAISQRILKGHESSIVDWQAMKELRQALTQSHSEPMVPWSVAMEYVAATESYNMSVSMNDGKPTQSHIERYAKALTAFQSHAPKTNA